MHIYLMIGQIASGKSAIANYLNKQPLTAVIDLDLICHELYKQPEIIADITSYLHENFLIDTQDLIINNGEQTAYLNRKNLRKILFTHKKANTIRQWLEQYIHPRIYTTGMQALQNYQFQGVKKIFVAMPIPSINSPWLKLNIQAIIDIQSNYFVRLERLIQRNIENPIALQIINHQAHLYEMFYKCIALNKSNLYYKNFYQINNNSSLYALEQLMNLI